MTSSSPPVTFGEHTLAVLFTDVVDSTRALEHAGDAEGGSLWGRHDRLARSLVRTWGGREVGRSDGFLLLFAQCHDALGFATAYHAILAEMPTPWTARVGCHWGTVALRSNLESDVAAGATPFEVDGVALPTAARVMSVARGGQTLFSRAAAEHLAPHLGAAERNHSHGHWRLKGLDEPVELFEVGAHEPPPMPPSGSSKAYRVVRRDGLWSAAQSLPNNLGAEPDLFVGRDQALRALAGAFEAGARIITLLGIGGIGKTRLAQRYGRAWLGAYAGGGWFCDLAQARGTDGIAFAVAQALDVPLGRNDPVERLANLIAARGACLLVLDNFEHVARCAAETLGRWSRAAPEARFLVTSREVLGLPGEQVQVLPPLSCDEAVVLFEHRLATAGQAEPLAPGDRVALPQLVELLDRLPLAVELAAARGRTMAPAELVGRMGERFRLLAVRSGRDHRQATLKATLDWSWELLNDFDRTALAQLSVFEGGFTLPAAEAVLDLSRPNDDAWAGDALQSLVEKSLVRRLRAGRFDLLQTVRHYAAERLAPREAAAFSRHWRHFAALSDAEASAESGIELDNIVAACRRACEAAAGGADADAASGAVDTLGKAWAALRLSGPFRAIGELAAPLAGLESLDELQRARVQRVLGGAAAALGRADDALTHYEQALGGASAAGAPGFAAELHCLIGDLHALHGRPDAAEASLRRAAEWATGPSLASLMFHNAMGNLELTRSNAPASIRHYEQALSIALALGDRRWQGGLHGSLGSAAVVQGHFELGREHLQQAVRVADELGDRQWAGNAHCNLGLLLLDLKQPEAARAELGTALSLARFLGHRHLEATALCNLGLVDASLGDLGAALDHFESSVELAVDLKAPRLEGLFRGYLGELLGRLGRAADALGCHRKAETLLRTAGDIAGLSLLGCQRAMSAICAGDPATAAAALRDAEALAASLPGAPDAELGTALQRARESFNSQRSR